MTRAAVIDMAPQAIAKRRWPASGSPAIESPEPPTAAFDFDRLAAMAARLLRDRRDRFPAEVDAGKLSQADADRELLAFDYLAANWRFIATGDGVPSGYGADHVLRDALDESILRIAAHVEIDTEITGNLGASAEAIIALRWHLEPGRETLANARSKHLQREQSPAAGKSRSAAK